MGRSRPCDKLRVPGQAVRLVAVAVAYIGAVAGIEHPLVKGSRVQKVYGTASALRGRLDSFAEAANDGKDFAVGAYDVMVRVA